MRERGLMAVFLVALSVACHGAAWCVWHLRRPANYNELLFSIANYIELASTLSLSLAVASVSLVLINPRAIVSTSWSYSWLAIASLLCCLAGWVCAATIVAATGMRGGPQGGAGSYFLLLQFAMVAVGLIASLVAIGLGGWCFVRPKVTDHVAGAITLILSPLSMALVLQLAIRWTGN